MQCHCNNTFSHTRGVQLCSQEEAVGVGHNLQIDQQLGLGEVLHLVAAVKGVKRGN